MDIFPGDMAICNMCGAIGLVTSVKPSGRTSLMIGQNIITSNHKVRLATKKEIEDSELNGVGYNETQHERE